MTCASCASRVERSLNNLDGVAATVNFATEKATVEVEPGAAGSEALVKAVEQAGYHAVLPADAAGEPRAADTGAGRTVDRTADPSAVLLRRLAMSAALTLPVLALSMVSALQFGGWEWVALALATPVVLWGALPFHRAAL